MRPSQPHLVLLSVVVLLLAFSHTSLAVFVWWNPTTWIEKPWKPLAELKPNEIRKTGYYAVAQHNYVMEGSENRPDDVVKFVSVIGGRYRDGDERNREFKLVIKGLDVHGKARKYDVHLFRVVPKPDDQKFMGHMVSSEHIYVVQSFKKK